MILVWGRVEEDAYEEFRSAGRVGITSDRADGRCGVGACGDRRQHHRNRVQHATGGRREVEVRCEGVYDLPKNSADALSAGDIARVNPAGVVSLAGTVPIGWVCLAAGAGSNTARVRLVPGIS